MTHLGLLPASKPQWIWRDHALKKKRERIFLRRDFVLDGPVKEASIVATAQEQMVLYVNGQELSTSDRTVISDSIEPGSRIQVTGELALDLIVDDTILIELAEGATVTVPEAPAEGAIMVTHLSQGELRIRTTPRFSGLRLNVTTGEGTVELTGTVVS